MPQETQQQQDAAALLLPYVDTVLENSDAGHPYWNREVIRSGEENRWNYIDGCMIRGILELYSITGKEKYLTFADRYVGYFVQEGGSVRTYCLEDYTLDNINGARNLFLLYEKTGKEKYRKAMDLFRSQLDTQPRTFEGSFWHKKIYPDQVWLDGIYMAMPFYAQYEVVCRRCGMVSRSIKGTGIEDVCRQIELVGERMRDPKTGLYYHGYDASRRMYWADKETGCSSCFWLRAIGWFILGLADVLEILMDLPEYQAHVTKIGTMFRDLAGALVPYQDPSGLFYQLVDQKDLPGNYLESSGSALVAAALLKGARLGFLDDDLKKAGERCFEGLVRERLTKGEDNELHLTGICLVAGLGGVTHRDGSPAYYLSEPVVDDDAKGIGPLFLAFTERLRTEGGLNG